MINAGFADFSSAQETSKYGVDQEREAAGDRPGCG
jgi:hypothetical protein